MPQGFDQILDAFVLKHTGYHQHPIVPLGSAYLRWGIEAIGNYLNRHLDILMIDIG
jgi:hypothetical protein